LRPSSAREDAERFIAEVRGDDPEVAANLRIEEREPAAGGRASSRALTKERGGERRC
jgi:hypothetical protein